MSQRLQTQIKLQNLLPDSFRQLLLEEISVYLYFDILIEVNGRLKRVFTLFPIECDSFDIVFFLKLVDLWVVILC